MNKFVLWVLFLVLFILGWAFLIRTINPFNIVVALGSNNTYLILFVIGLLGGISSLTSITFYTALVTFAIGGANPILLGISGGVSATIGDSLFYLLGIKGGKAAYHSPKVRKNLEKFTAWLKNKPVWVLDGIVFAWVLMPFLPNDILTLSLGAAKQKYAHILPWLLIGNIITLTLLAYIAIQGKILFGAP